MARAAAIGVEIVVPHVADAEVLSGLRGLFLSRQIDHEDFTDAAEVLATMPMPRFPMRGLHQRVVQLRDNLTTYDATYVALAEALDLKLVTFDRGIARAPGITCDVMLLEA